MYAHIFMKPVNGGDFNRYWASISTEAVDIDGEGSGEYYQASVEVKMSSKAREVFEENAEKTSNKKIVGGLFDIADFWLKAGKPADIDGEERQRLILFINKMDIPEQKSKKPAKKASGAKKRAAADAEDA